MLIYNSSTGYTVFYLNVVQVKTHSNLFTNIVKHMCTFGNVVAYHIFFI